MIDNGDDLIAEPPFWALLLENDKEAIRGFALAGQQCDGAGASVISHTGGEVQCRSKSGDAPTGAAKSGRFGVGSDTGQAKISHSDVESDT